MKKIWLKKGKDAAVKRFHPWIFSGAVAKMEEGLQDGDVVQVLDHKEQILATGHYQNGSILVRILAFSAREINQDFWIEKIAKAYRYRSAVGLTGSPETTCYRLVQAAGDQLPGLIVDIYGDTAVVQCHTVGMHRERERIARALLSVFDGKLQTIYDKSEHTLPTQYAAAMSNGYLHGAGSEAIVQEYGHAFLVNWETGQKTGFFLDQRENRRLLSHYAAGKTILNAFCYSGGFSVYGLAAGAVTVDSVDISETAIQLADRNIALNAPQLEAGRHRSIKADVMKYIAETDRHYDLMILDPPAFAKSKQKRHNAVQAYKRLNALALKKILPGGILFTFSCSNVVDRQLFRDTIVAAAMESSRPVRVMHELGQPPDHPVNFFHPEGAYLKGLVLYVE